MKYRIAALTLIFSLLLSPVALASQALGWELGEVSTPIGPGVTVTRQRFWGDSIRDYRYEEYLTYTPTGLVTPTVAYGGAIRGKNTLSTLAKGLESGGARVLGGANGDYFVVSTGVPLGLVITGGVVRSSSSYHHAVGFRPDGTAFVGKPEMSVWAQIRGSNLIVGGGYNKTRGTDGPFVLYNADFGTATGNSGAGVEVVLRPVYLPPDYAVPQTDTVYQTDPESGEMILDPETGEALVDESATAAARDAALAAAAASLETLPAALTVNGARTCVVEAVRETSGSGTIPPGRFLLSLDAQKGSEYHKTLLRELKVGEQITLSTQCAQPGWEEAVTAMGAYARILEGGVIPAGLDAAAAPRTALGVRQDGSVLLYTMDGRKAGHSMGASVKQIAARLLELGCTDAVLFDGGGSTTFGATEAVNTAFAVTNTPSDGAQRAVSNALFFVSRLAPTGELGSLAIAPQGTLLLSGAMVALTAQGVDTHYHPTGKAVEDVVYTANGYGSVENNIFRAGPQTGDALITGTYALPGEEGAAVTGQTRLKVIATPHTMEVKDEATGRSVTTLNLEPGEQLALTADCAWYKLPLLDSDTCYTWQVSGPVGTVDPTGLLTAGNKYAAGTLTVTAGEKTLSIPVTVAGHVYPLETFEQDLPGLTVSGEQVRYGTGAWKLTYPAGGVQIPLKRTIPQDETHLGLWAYGAGAEMTLELGLTLSDGSPVTLPVTAEPFTGWQQFLLPLPAGTAALTGVTVRAETPGTLFLDHFTTSNGPIQDREAPQISLNVTGSALSATLFDNVDKTFLREKISVTLDGISLPFTLEKARLTAPFVPDGGPHRLTVTVADGAGNLSRATAPVGGGESPFADTAGHWAQGDIAYLYARGVTQGSVEGEGLVFRPGDHITRGEFAAMLARWLGWSGEGGTLPFMDTAAIPPWALGPVSALYARGVFTGSAEADGLYANAAQSLTRAQAVTMLGRVLPRGYSPRESLFADDAAIPAWAREQLYTLAGLGVVSGYENLVRPNDPITRAEVAKLLSAMG